MEGWIDDWWFDWWMDGLVGGLSVDDNLIIHVNLYRGDKGRRNAHTPANGNPVFRGTF